MDGDRRSTDRSSKPPTPVKKLDSEMGRWESERRRGKNGTMLVDGGKGNNQRN